MVTEDLTMSLTSKREYLAKIHGRYQRAGRGHKGRILDEFCLNCGYHRKAALRLLNRPLGGGPPKRSGPKLIYDPAELLPVLKAVWLASDQLCSKLLRPALAEWLGHHERRTQPLPEAFKEKLLAISPAQLDRLLQPVRVRYPRKGLAATRPGTLLRGQVPTRSGPPATGQPGSVEADTVAHCGDTTAGDYVNSLTFTELFSGWTENRAVWNKSSYAILEQLRAIEAQVPFAMKNFHTDNGSEFLNWALYEHLTGRKMKVPFTRSRAYRKNDNAHCEQKNWTHVRQLFGHERFEHPELVALMNDLYAQEWGQFTNHFKPTFKLLKRDKRGSKTVRVYEPVPQTPYQRLLASPDIAEAAKAKLRQEHAALDPFELKKNIERKLKNFFTVLGNLHREATKS
jgi:transposase InsO family protein